MKQELPLTFVEGHIDFYIQELLTAKDEVGSIHEVDLNQHLFSTTLFHQKDNSECFQTWSYFSKLCHNDIRSSLSEMLLSSTQSKAKSNLILVLNLTLQTSAKYLNLIKHHYQTSKQRKMGPRLKITLS